MQSQNNTTNILLIIIQLAVYYMMNAELLHPMM